MITFICLNCDAVDPPYDTNHRCLLCYSGSVIVNEAVYEMDLKAYLFLYKDLFKAQAEMIRTSGKCLGYDNKMYDYDSVDHYVEMSSQFIHEHITSGESLEEVKARFEEIVCG